MPPSCSCSYCHPQLSDQAHDQATWRCSLPLSLSMLFYCSSFDSFSLTLCTFKHRKGICTYLSSYLPRLHNELDYVRLSRNFKQKFAHTLCMFRQKFVRTLCTFKAYLFKIKAKEKIHPIFNPCAGLGESKSSQST